MKRIMVANATVCLIVLLALASQASGAITAAQTIWPENGTGAELNLVPVGLTPGSVSTPAISTGQVDIMDSLYGVGNWQQLDDGTALYNPDGSATATAKYAGNSELVSYVGLGTSSVATPNAGQTVQLWNITGGNFLGPQTPVLLPVDAKENFYLSDLSGGNTWYSSGPGAPANSDGMTHALVFQILSVPGEYAVAFEDLPKSSSDLDYNDMVLQLNGVTGTTPGGVTTPEPCSAIVWSLLGAAGVGLTFLRKRKAA